MTLSTREDAYALLRMLGAPPRLLLHVQLVHEAAARLTEAYRQLGLVFDAQQIELGVALHDAGKISFPAELDQPGARHEPAGEQLLLAHGVPVTLARCCITHAAWQDDDVTFEDRTVALADKLWKGRREPELELRVIDEAAQRLGVDRWTVYPVLDSAFESIAADGDERLQRSRIPQPD